MITNVHEENQAKICNLFQMGLKELKKTKHNLGLDSGSGRLEKSDSDQRKNSLKLDLTLILTAVFLPPLRTA